MSRSDEGSGIRSRSAGARNAAAPAGSTPRRASTRPTISDTPAAWAIACPRRSTSAVGPIQRRPVTEASTSRKAGDSSMARVMPAFAAARHPPPAPLGISYRHETLSSSPRGPANGRGEKMTQPANAGFLRRKAAKAADRQAPAEREPSWLPEAGATPVGRGQGAERPLQAASPRALPTVNGDEHAVNAQRIIAQYQCLDPRRARATAWHPRRSGPFQRPLRSRGPRTSS